MEKKVLSEQIDKIVNELDAIAERISNDKEISIYKSFLLNLKLHVLESYFDNAVDELRIICNEETKKQKIISNIVTLSLLSSFIVAFINPYVFLLLMYISFYGSRKINSWEENRKSEINKIDKKVSQTKRVFNSSYSMIREKEPKLIHDSRLPFDNEKLKEIDLANKYIEMVLNGEAIPTISPNIQQTVISILQSDLKTNENDIEKLLELAFEKTINEMALLNGISLKRTNGCNLE